MFVDDDDFVTTLAITDSLGLGLLSSPSRISNPKAQRAYGDKLRG
ncbi:hypothetical protein CGRA01v4_03298 [Colletotrichum graminicola]|nr:hypothetical protein CGRA01v4_03298 [Colletotrichum graminicola]